MQCNAMYLNMHKNLQNETKNEIWDAQKSTIIKDLYT